MFIDLLIFVCKDVTEIEQEQEQAAKEESILKWVYQFVSSLRSSSRFFSFFRWRDQISEPAIGWVPTSSFVPFACFLFEPAEQAKFFRIFGEQSRNTRKKITPVLHASFYENVCYAR